MSKRKTLLKDYEIQRCNLIKGSRWIVFKRISKNLQIHVYAGMTKKECEAWVKNEMNEIKRKRKINEKRKNKSRSLNYNKL